MAARSVTTVHPEAGPEARPAADMDRGRVPAGPRAPDVVVVGLGNGIRGDDAVGLLALRRLSGSGRWPGVRFVESEESNINLLEVLEGAGTLLLLDTISTADGRHGTVHHLDIDALRGAGEAYATHQVGVARVLDLGRTLVLPMPESATILALEIAPSDDFGLGLSPEGRAGLERLVSEATSVLDRFLPPGPTRP